MTKKFAEFHDEMSAEARQDVVRRVDKAPEATVFQLYTDMYLSALRRHIEAMGGELEITVRFPDRTVKITNFSQL